MSLLSSSVKGQAKSIARRALQQKRHLAAVARRAADQDDETTFGSLPSSSFTSSPSPAPVTRIVQPRFPQLEFPAPVLTEFPRQSSNSLKVISSTPLATVAHTLAIVRAVEKECANTVVDVKQRKSRDYPGGSTVVHLTLLYPVEFPKNNPSREIRVSLPLLSTLTHPDPKIRNGGPTLQEVELALNPPSSSILRAERQMTHFSIQVELNPPETYPIRIPKEEKAFDRSSVTRSRRDRRLDESAQQRIWAEEAQKPLRDEQAIVEVLGKWKGRYGGFKSLNQMYEGYKSPQTVEREMEARQHPEAVEAEQAQDKRRRSEEIERQQVAQEERATRRAAASEELKATSSSTETDSLHPINSTLNNTIGATPLSPKRPTDPAGRPIPQHAPTPPPLRPSEKRILAAKFGPIATASASTSGEIPSYRLSSQQGKVDALRQEAWDTKARKEEEFLSGDGKSGFKFISDFIQKGMGGGAVKSKQ